MARLQRKKPAGAKQKTKSSVESSGSAGENPTAAAVKPALNKPAKKPALAGTKKQVMSARGTLAKKEPNIFDRAKQFLREVKVELKKVTWPTRQQTLGSTVVVIILVLLIAAFLGIVDTLLSSLVRLVMQ
jgi:preprotein translocase subunit SecE